MNSINQNLNNDYKIRPQNMKFGANEAPAFVPNSLNEPAKTQDIQLPDMYYMPEHYKKPTTAKEKIKKLDIMGLVYPWLEHPLLMLGTCAGISLGIDAFERSCNKEYDKSIIGKAAKFGDKIEKSRFIQSDGAQEVLHGIGKGWSKTKEFALKNSVIYSIFKTPSQPEFSMPKDEIKGINFRVVTKFKELVRALDIMPSDANDTEKLMENVINKRQLTLKSLAVNKEEIDYLKKTYNVDKISKINETECVNRLNLRRIGKSEAEIASIIKQENAYELVKNEMFNKLISGFTKEDFDLVMKDEYGVHLDKVTKMAKNIDGLKVNNFPLMGILKTPGTNQPLANVLSGQSVYNMGHSLKINGGAETKTGKFMAAFMQMIHRGFTFGGTKFGVMIFVAPLLVETMINTKKADRKEKVGTAVEGAVNTVSWVFTFPLVLKAIYAYGGIQYAGMGKDKVEKHRELVNKFNKDVLDGKLKDKAKYKEARRELEKQLKKLRHVEKQSFFVKMLRGVSHFTKADLGRVEAYRGKNQFWNFIKSIPNKAVFKIGYSAARFLVFMLVGMSLADKLIKKCTSAIFGKAYDQYKEEEIHDAKERQEEFTMNDLRARMLKVQENKINPQTEVLTAESTVEMPKFPNPAQRMLDVELDNEVDSDEVNSDVVNNDWANGKTEQNILNDNNEENTAKDEQKTLELNHDINNENTAKDEQKTLELNHDINNENRKRDNYTYIPSQENVLNQLNSQEQINKYIPAQTGIQLTKTFDNSEIESAMRRAERAEKRAISTLAGNFGGSEEI